MCNFLRKKIILTSILLITINKSDAQKLGDPNNYTLIQPQNAVSVRIRRFLPLLVIYWRKTNSILYSTTPKKQLR
jgi:hypothetical protein